MVKKLLFLALCGLAGCSNQVDKSQLPGTYQFALGELRQVVVIHEDGRYVNTLYKDGVVRWSDQQVWTYEEEGGKSGLTFVGFRFGIPGHSSSPGFWFVIPEKMLWGPKKLCFDADLGQCFQSS